MLKKVFRIQLGILFFFLTSALHAQSNVSLKPFQDKVTGIQISFPSHWSINKLDKDLIVEAVSPAYPKGGGQDSVNLGFVDVDEDLSGITESEWKAVGNEIYNKAVPGSKIMDSEFFMVNGVKGYEVLGKATVAGKNIILGQFYIPQKKRVYIITLATQEHRLEQLRPIFKSIIQTFKI